MLNTRGPIAPAESLIILYWVRVSSQSETICWEETLKEHGTSWIVLHHHQTKHNHTSTGSATSTWDKFILISTCVQPSTQKHSFEVAFCNNFGWKHEKKSQKLSTGCEEKNNSDATPKMSMHCAAEILTDFSYANQLAQRQDGLSMLSYHFVPEEVRVSHCRVQKRAWEWEDSQALHTDSESPKPAF